MKQKIRRVKRTKPGKNRDLEKQRETATRSLSSTVKQLTVKELRYLLFEKVENQDAPVAFYRNGKLLPLVAINEAVDQSVVTLGFFDEEAR